MAVQPDGIEEALDHDQVPAALDPVQVEELEALVKSLGEFVLFFARRKIGLGTNPAASVGHDLAVHIVDWDAQPSGHDPLPAVAETKGLDDQPRHAALNQVRMTRIEIEGEAKWLVGF
jgi:hypothetical protein